MTIHFQSFRPHEMKDKTISRRKPETYGDEFCNFSGIRGGRGLRGGIEQQRRLSHGRELQPYAGTGAHSRRQFFGRGTAGRDVLGPLRPRASAHVGRTGRPPTPPRRPRFESKDTVFGGGGE